MTHLVRRGAVALAALALSSWIPALAETRIEKNLKLDPGGKLTVVSDAGSVKVTGSGASGAHVVLTSNRDDLETRFELAFEELPGEVRVTMKKKEPLAFWSGWFNNSRVSFEIQVPAKTAASVSTGGGHVTLAGLEGNATAETSGGHIDVKDLKGSLLSDTSGGHITLNGISGDAKADTSGGHIEADGIGGSLWAETSGGHIDVANVAKDVHAETSGGSIEIQNAKGRVDADTSGGHVEVGFALGNARGGKIESSGGGITVSIDPKVDLAIDASTSGGSVRSDIPVSVVGKISGSSIKGTLGKGGELLYVHTSGGGVTIRAAGGTM